MYTRICSKCQETIEYKSYGGWHNSKKKGDAKCRKCVSKETGFTKRYATKGSNNGENNPFYGKKHTEETKEKMRLVEKDYSYVKTDEFKEKMSSVTKGSKNAMYGKKIYDIWIKKYGKEKANELEIKRRYNMSNSMSGKNNPMYGKPSPKGSGVGWKGWINETYFRSLREACFIINCIENNKDFKCAEYIKIEYVDCLGHNRTYRPDFIIDNELIEIKPKRLHSSPNNLLKFEAAKKYCENNNLTFNVIDFEICVEKIKEFKNQNKLKFAGKYEERFNNYVNNIKGTARVN